MAPKNLRGASLSRPCHPLYDYDYHQRTGSGDLKKRERQGFVCVGESEETWSSSVEYRK